jgi:hypothetical protein
MKESTIDRIISIVRHYIIEEGISTSAAPTNSTNPPGQINIAGLPPDSPPRKNKNNIFLGKGSRKNWMQKRKPPQ